MRLILSICSFKHTASSCKKLYFLTKIIALSIACLASATILGKIVTPKWTKINTVWEPATLMTEGFYHEPNHSIDVLYLGSSLIYRGISPITMWEKYGFTGYIRGSSVQRMWISYYYLEDTLKTQHPKVVVLNMNGITDDTQNDENRNRKALDYMKLSMTKIHAVQASLTDGESFISYLFPLLRYHSRWDNLTQEDFTQLTANKHYFAKGQDLQFGITSCHPKDDWLKPTSTVAKEGEKAGQYFDRIVKLCRENGIALLLIDMVSPVRFSYDVHNLNRSLAQQYNLPYLDLNMMTDQFGLNWDTDMLDPGVHLNVSGAEKCSAFLGKYLKEHYSLGQNVSEDIKKIWEQDAADYEQEKADFSLLQETDFTDYLKKLKNQNYITMISVKGYVPYSLSKEQLHAFYALGLKTDFTGKKNWSYLAVLDEKPIVEKSSAQPLTLQMKVEDLPVQIQSFGYDIGNSSVIKIGRTDFSPNLPGFNFVVYDKRFKKVVDCVSFNLEESQTAHRHASS